MSLLDSLDLAERAQQLCFPKGAQGLAVADALNEINREGNLRTVGELKLEQGARVLEIGCGTASMAAVVTSQAENVHYTGLDRASTMITAARERNSELVAKKLAGFTYAHAENMPFDDAAFTDVFSIGVIHFWPQPSKGLTEVRRVMRPGGLMLMGCLGPERAPPFARAEYGFHLHEPQTWRAYCQEAGFDAIKIQTRSLNSERGPQIIHLAARA